MVSIAASVIPVLFAATRGRRRSASRVEVLARIAEARPYEGMPRLRGVEVRRADGLITITPPNATGLECVWFHGGSYVHDLAPQHFSFARALALATGATMTLPVYGLAPHQTAERTVAIAAEQLAARPDAVVGGDSAGGGLAVAAALAAGGSRRTLLVSPWLDVRMSDPAIPALEARDPWLTVLGLRVSGELYRGALPDDDPRVSPILADLDALGDVTVLCGDRDVLLADTLALQRRLPRAEVHVEPGMLHVYPLLPIPEAKPARALLAARLVAPAS